MDEHGAMSKTPRTQYLGESKSLEALSPLEQLRLCTFDNVSSLIRKSAWTDNPFPRVPFAEDLAWGKAELLRGRKLIYQPESRVIHSHRRGPIYEYRRSRIAHQRLAELFDLRLVSSVPLLIRYSLQNMLRLTCWALQAHPMRLGDVFQAPLVAMAETLGQYTGARGAIYQGEEEL
jgi:hypothetical protein